MSEYQDAKSESERRFESVEEQQARGEEPCFDARIAFQLGAALATGGAERATEEWA